MYAGGTRTELRDLGSGIWYGYGGGYSSDISYFGVRTEAIVKGLEVDLLAPSPPLALAAVTNQQ